MIVIMQAGATEAQIDGVAKKLESLGFGIQITRGEKQTIIGAIGDKSVLQEENLTILPGVQELVHVRKPYKRASREFHPDNSIIRLGKDIAIGEGLPVLVIAGPCTVENREQMMTTARRVAKEGARALRGGAFKPRTSPYSFQGLEEEGLKLLAEARKETNLPIVTEVLDTRHVDLVAQYADVMQIGARNMQNFNLLKEVGKLKKPVLLKRGLSATIEELLLSAEYIMHSGSPDVILCERGIRTHETGTRNTLDLSAIPHLKEVTHLPVVIDPSHSTGKWKYVAPMARAAVAAGADGLIIEVHPNPQEALCDGPQSLNLDKFAKMMVELRAIANAIARKI